MDAVLKGLSNVFTFEAMIVLVIGTVAGMIIGASPGLSSTMGVALEIPITFSCPLKALSSCWVPFMSVRYMAGR